MTSNDATELIMRRATTLALVLWLAALGHLAAHHANRPFVSAAQLQMADVVVAAEVIGSQGGIVRARVVERFKGKLDEETLRVDVRNVLRVRLQAGRRYIFALTRAGDTYQPTRYPLRSEPRVYPDNGTVRKQVRWALSSDPLTVP